MNYPQISLASLRRFCIGMVAGVGIISGALAATTPEDVIKATTSAIRTDIAKNVSKYQADKASFYSMVETQVVPHFDTTYIAKVILGTHLKEASAQQVSQFEKAFKDMLVHSYADRLLQYYDSVEIQVKPGRVEADGKRASVDTVIVRKDGNPPIPVTFSMRNSKGEWKVWDIKAENISLVLNFRTQIDAEIRKSNVAAVIQRLNAGDIKVDEQAVAPAPKQ